MRSSSTAASAEHVCVLLICEGGPNTLFYADMCSNDVHSRSFAIVVVEIWTDGRKPYPKMNNRSVREGLERDPNFMHPNVECNDELYDLMKDCWKQDADARPNFASILQRLEEAQGRLKRSSVVGGAENSAGGAQPVQTEAAAGGDRSSVGGNSADPTEADGYERPVVRVRAAGAPVPAPRPSLVGVYGPTIGAPNPQQTACARTSAGRKCKKPAAFGSKYCEDHTCPHPGCRQPKRKTAPKCRTHSHTGLVNNATTTVMSPVFDYTSRDAGDALLDSQV